MGEAKRRREAGMSMSEMDVNRLDQALSRVMSLLRELSPDDPWLAFMTLNAAIAELYKGAIQQDPTHARMTRRHIEETLSKMLDIQSGHEVEPNPPPDASHEVLVQRLIKEIERALRRATPGGDGTFSAVAPPIAVEALSFALTAVMARSEIPDEAVTRMCDELGLGLAAGITDLRRNGYGPRPGGGRN